MRILITGHCGFIGSNFHRFIKRHYTDIITFDKLDGQDLVGDISGLLEGVDIVVNFAAKTFVDHSIKDPSCFVRNNIIGTFNLLEEARRYPVKKFIHISTDEVYGSIEHGRHTEEDTLNPGNPYSATKASADMLCLSYFNTYGIPIIILRPENNYGFNQHKQKLIPCLIDRVINNRPIVLYGDGKHRRMWLRVEDFCSAILKIINDGKIGEIYNVGSEQETENIYIVKKVLEALGKPNYPIEYVPDNIARPGHDRRYAMSIDKLKSLGWKPEYTIDSINEVIEWYK